MSEIKVGDRVKCYYIEGDDEEANLIGFVIEIKGRVIKVSSSYSDKSYYCIFHSYQCRKLVKARKCWKCKGEGKYSGVTICYNGNYEKIYHSCEQCNGSGKVKV